MIVFTHVPKTGGMAIRGMLESALPLRSVYYAGRQSWYMDKDAVFDAEYDRCLAYVLRKNAPGRLRVVFGHVGHGFCSDVKGVRYVTMLRDPVDRVASLWRMMGRPAAHEFFQACAEARDGMVARFGCGDVGRAMDALRSYSLVGFTETFGQFAVDLGAMVGCRRPRYCVTNATIHRPMADEILAGIFAHNQKDIELYEWALRCFAAPETREAESVGRRNELLAPLIRLRQRYRRSMCKLHPAVL